MALTYNAFGNTPCTINRGYASSATVADGLTRNMRVSNYGVPTPIGFFGANYIGDFDNPLFFKKLLAASMQITGATAPEQMSGITFLPVFVYNAQPGNPNLDAAWAGTFPNGRLLTAPFFENFLQIDGNNSTPALVSANPAHIAFEDTLGVSAPRWADISVTLHYPSAPDVPLNDDNYMQVKIFHSLTY